MSAAREGAHGCHMEEDRPGGPGGSRDLRAKHPPHKQPFQMLERPAGMADIAKLDTSAPGTYLPHGCKGRQDGRCFAGKVHLSAGASRLPFPAYLQTVSDQCLQMSEAYDAGITSGRPTPPWQAASYNKLVTADAGMDSFEKANIFLPRSFIEAPMCQTSALPVAADLQSASAPSIIMKRS